jgi:hypothetical protein
MNMSSPIKTIEEFVEWYADKYDIVEELARKLVIFDGLYTTYQKEMGHLNPMCERCGTEDEVEQYYCGQIECGKPQCRKATYLLCPECLGQH